MKSESEVPTLTGSKAAEWLLIGVFLRKKAGLLKPDLLGIFGYPEDYESHDHEVDDDA